MTKEELITLARAKYGHGWQTRLSELTPYTRHYINYMAQGVKPISKRAEWIIMTILNNDNL